MADKNFDQLIDRMQTRVYAGPKGQLRLALLQQQLATLCTELPARARVLDAGVGQGHLACALADRGHAVHGIDISAAMLDSARELAVQRAQKIELQHASIADFAVGNDEHFDLICCHAVIEWSDRPEENFGLLAQLLNPGGYLSLMFYNPEALVWRNLLRGNFYRAKKADEPGQSGGLTPQHMLSLQQVEGMAADAGLRVAGRCGVRVLYDYLPKDLAAARSEEDLLDMELWLCQREPHWRLGRYLHVVLQAV